MGNTAGEAKNLLIKGWEREGVNKNKSCTGEELEEVFEGWRMRVSGQRRIHDKIHE